MAEYEPTINSLNDDELIKLLTDCFYVIGREFDPKNVREVDIFISEMRKYQGKTWVVTFQNAFSRYAAGGLAQELKSSVSPYFVARLIKIMWDEKKSQKRKETTKTWTEQDEWNAYVRFIKFYKMIPSSRDWIALWNYCRDQGWFYDESGKELRRIEGNFDHRKHRLAEEEVIGLTKEMFAEFIKYNADNNPHNKGVPAQAGNLGRHAQAARDRTRQPTQ